MTDQRNRIEKILAPAINWLAETITPGTYYAPKRVLNVFNDFANEKRGPLSVAAVFIINEISRINKFGRDDHLRPLDVTLSIEGISIGGKKLGDWRCRFERVNGEAKE